MKNSSISPQEAARELLVRRAARKNIIDYARAIDIPGAPVNEIDEDCNDFFTVETEMAEHHRLILNAAWETSQTKHGRLMIFAPPGSAKSTYASVVFPSDYLGSEPNRRVILASYGDTLARKMGRRTRAIIRQSRYQGIFKTGLAKDSHAANEFALDNGSEYIAAGILSGITGNRAHGIIIDDPVKGRADAKSVTIQNSTFDAYQDDLKTRLIPGGWIILIQTRWDKNDLAGKILPDSWKGESGIIRCKDGMDWKIICLQARCETDTDPLGRKRGEYLWEGWFDEKHWAQFESSPITWPSLYQQIPSPAEGRIFKPDKIQIVDAIPAGVTDWVRGWDLASISNDGDWTAGGRIGKMPDGRIIIAGMARFQYGPDERDAAIKNTASQDGKETRISLPQDPGQAGKTQVLYMTRQLAGYTVKTSPESGDKVTRAEPFAAQVNVGNVVMLRGDWNQALIDEMRMFDASPDDQIDALSRAYAEILSARSSFFG